jgi:hypothetical protein
MSGGAAPCDVAPGETDAMRNKLATIAGVQAVFASPRALPKPPILPGGVVVLDIAFAAEGGGKSFETTTLPFIDALGARLDAWVDHHDSRHHARYAADRRFVLSTKAEHGACPELITPELVASFARPETIVCHNDFDGLASAAKWLNGGREPYAGCDRDARAVDTCTGELGPVGRRFERALRAAPRDFALLTHALALLVAGAPEAGDWRPIDAVAARLEPLERRAAELGARYRLLGAGLALIDVSDESLPYDKTALLLHGQRLARMAAVVDGDTVTFAAPFGSGIDFLERFGLSGGMPTRVSIRRSELGAALKSLGVEADLS